MIFYIQNCFRNNYVIIFCPMVFRFSCRSWGFVSPSWKAKRRGTSPLVWRRGVLWGRWVRICGYLHSEVIEEPLPLKLKIALRAAGRCTVLNPSLKQREFWEKNKKERVLGNRFSVLLKRLASLLESASTGAWCAPGFGAGSEIEIALNPRTL